MHVLQTNTPGNETFKKGSIRTVIEATSRKDRKLKVKFKIMIQKNTDWLKDVTYNFMKE